MADIFMERVTNAHNIRTETIGNIVYVGKARIGTQSSDPLWSIQSFDKTLGISSGWADGSAAFDKAWDDKATYTYS